MDLSQVDLKSRNFDALHCTDAFGQFYILINIKHKNAPAEAIASLLSHEVIHQNPSSSIEEETVAWANEAISWIYFKKQNPELNNFDPNRYPLVRRLNRIEKMYKDAGYTAKEIKLSVASNPGYKNLPQYSKGFGI